MSTETTNGRLWEASPGDLVQAHKHSVQRWEVTGRINDPLTNAERVQLRNTGDGRYTTASCAMSIYFTGEKVDHG